MKIKTISALALLAIFSLYACNNNEEEIRVKQKELDSILPKAEKILDDYNELRLVIDAVMLRKAKGEKLDELQEAKLNFLIDVSGKKANTLDSISKIAEKLRSELDILKKNK